MAIALLCLACFVAGLALAPLRRALLAGFAMTVVYAGFYGRVLFTALHPPYAVAALVGTFLLAGAAASLGTLARHCMVLRSRRRPAGD